MIIRPGKVPVWYFIERSGEGVELFFPSARLVCRTMGEDIEYRHRRAPKECCGVIFVARLDGGIACPDCWRINWFFERDKAEALVFEYDIWQKRLFARNQESIWNRCVRRR